MVGTEGATDGGALLCVNELTLTLTLTVTLTRTLTPTPTVTLTPATSCLAKISGQISSPVPW